MPKKMNNTTYGSYAHQRLFRILLDLQQEDRDLNWSSMAERIYLWRGIRFQRINFYRLKSGTLNSDNVEIIVSWVEQEFDKTVRERLVPQAIFGEMGRTARDYYFNLPVGSDVDDWNEQILDRFAGVYLCAPAGDINSFMPLNRLRRWFDDYKSFEGVELKGRSLDIKQYINERSILVLQKTQSSYFYAAEFPLSLILSKSFETLDIKMVYEGVAIVSANTIQVKLRDCLSRVPKTHSILIKNKAKPQLSRPFGFSFHIPEHAKAVQEEWQMMSLEEREMLRQEYRLSFEAEQHLSGPSQITVSPISYAQAAVTTNFSRDCIYFRKPANLLQDVQTHFIRPDVVDVDRIQKIIDNPLSIGKLL
ncbi:MAG: hypothetical protein COA47_14375 [Robiginitomaculum sp.]|nr:MAG: hypothetical protein COA47_14375 [Robiginitomaculum sp.]